MSTIQTRIEYFGRLQVHQPVKPAPAPVDEHKLDSVPGIHTCTGCLWAVFTYSDEVHPAITADGVRRAFAKHLQEAAAAAA
jgi:hypothetical protein